MNVYQMLGYETIRTVLGPWVEFGFRVRSEGTENIPEEGGALLICNHCSIIDPLVLMTQVDRYINFMAGSRGMILPVLRTLYHMTGMVGLPLRSSARGLDRAISLMKNGELVGISPEGADSFTRLDRATKISHFRTDFVRIALEAGVPVIPAAVIPEEKRKLPDILSFSRSPKGFSKKEAESFLNYRSILVRVGKPISLENVREMLLNKATIDMLSGKLRRVIMKLYSGEDLDRFMTGEKSFDICNERV